ncbi:MAG: hypothetical protein Q9O74_07725 [Planctomycetota bacterium]|nr:hypothetical protein [Planctomycetota bacterium]
MATAQIHYVWRAIDIHPPEGQKSAAYAIGGGTPYGMYETGNINDHVGVKWPRLVPELIDLTPEGHIWSEIRGADGNKQAGKARSNPPESFTSGAVWYGTSESFQSLNEDDIGPTVHAIDGNLIVGEARFPDGPYAHAALWLNEDPDSLLNLHPTEAGSQGWSRAYATDGFWQGGTATLPGPGFHKATLWKGSATNYINMHPPGAKDSEIRGMAIGTQVGKMLVWETGDDHAVVWHDTAESWIDMHPSFHPGANSYMFATTGDIHVGRSNGRAGIWFGDDPDSFHDLQQYAPWAASSTAYDVEVYNGKLYVVGSAGNGKAHATVWIGTPVVADDPAVRKTPRGIDRK